MLPLTAAFRDHCSTFSLYEFDYSRCPYKWNNTILAPLCLAYFTCGFPGGSDSKESDSKECRRPRFDPWVGKIP